MLKKKLLFFLILLSFNIIFFQSNIFANEVFENKCSNKKFNIVSKKGSRIIDFVEQISDTCSLNLILNNSITSKVLDKKLNKIYLSDASLDEVLNIFLSTHNLFYSLKKNILEVSYIQTKTYNLDYITSKRTGNSKTHVQLSSSISNSGEGSSSTQTGEMGTSIESTETFNFWDNLKTEINLILNRPEDDFNVTSPIINRKAGLVTVSGTKKQLERLEIYLTKLEERLRKQVLIEVNIYSVKLSNSNSTGIDWGEFFANQQMDLSLTYSKADGFDSTFDVGGTVDLTEIIKFLSSNGKVTSISNPKILTLNNQPALISVGNEYFYKLTKTTSSSSSTTSVQIYESDEVESIFAGILLDITPEISNQNEITLKINPSVSSLLDATLDTTTDETRTLPPDITRKQISSVVKTKDGHRIILGGLITKTSSVEKNIVPLLGHLPIFGGLFRSSRKINYIEELVLIITPHIIENGISDLKKFNYDYIK